MQSWKGPVVVVCLALAGCAMSDDIHLSSYMQKGQHHELISALQPRVDAGEPMTTFKLFLLAAAYYEVRCYDKTLAAVERMEKSIAAGDTNYYGGDLTPYPKILRAAVSLDQGQYQQALQHAAQAQRLLRQDQFFFRDQLIRVMNILGVANAFLGRPEEARRCIHVIRSVNLAESNLGPEKYMAMARIHMALKEYDQALACVKNPEAKVSPTLTLFYDPTFQNVPKFFILCKSQYETGQTQEAKKGYDQLLKHPQIQQLGGIYWLVLLDRARIAQAEGDAAEAVNLLKKAVAVIEQQRSSIDTESGRIGFVGDKQAVYQTLVALLLAQGQTAEAFEYVERAKSRALVDLLASQTHIVVRAPKAADVESKLTELARAESTLQTLAPPQAQEGAAQTRSVMIDLKNEISAQAPELASLVTVTGAAAQEIQARLQPDEALVEYYYTDKDLFAFVMSKEGIRSAKLDRADLESHVSEFRAALIRPNSSDYVRGSQRLYQQLFEPLAAAVTQAKLIIVPHGVLHYLPFCALRTDSQYLIDRYSIRELPSANVLKFLKVRGLASDARTLILGNPDLGDPKYDLTFAQEEAQAIAAILPGPKVLLRREATKTFVKDQGEQYRILHFATHGLFDQRDPLNSALLLARDAQSDGRLRVSDLYTLKLDADLVTLSACETALGKVANGDDVVGFTRGLLYAGASSIVSSLWKVDDRATRDLMVNFYTHLPKLGKQEALRQAQLAVKKQHEHPFYWAAFVLTGSAQ